MARIKSLRKPHSMVIFRVKIKRSYRVFYSQADPARQNWIIRISSIKADVLCILTMFDINFLENARGFNRGVNWRNEIQSVRCLNICLLKE